MASQITMLMMPWGLDVTKNRYSVIVLHVSILSLQHLSHLSSLQHFLYNHDYWKALGVGLFLICSKDGITLLVENNSYGNQSRIHNSFLYDTCSSHFRVFQGNLEMIFSWTQYSGSKCHVLPILGQNVLYADMQMRLFTTMIIEKHWV